MPLHLVLGNKNYSSWSMRPWVALRAAGVPFRETAIDLSAPDAPEQKRRFSPAGRVPILEDGDVVVWDSLAICEYVAELHPESGLWPAGRGARARARSLSAEMHSGFAALRAELPMNIRRRRALARGPSAAAEDDLRRIREIFGAAEGPFLLGDFCAADAFYAPVACRLRSYDVALEGAAAEYAARLLAHEAVEAWVAGALSERQSMPKYDTV